MVAVNISFISYYSTSHLYRIQYISFISYYSSELFYVETLLAIQAKADCAEREAEREREVKTEQQTSHFV